MWVLSHDETVTLQRGTGGHLSGWEYVGKIHLEELWSRHQCDQLSHSLLSVSGRAVS